MTRFAKRLQDEVIDDLKKAMGGNVKTVELDYNGKRPYILKTEEKEIVKRLLNIDDIDLDKLTININDEGKILVRTPDYTWMSLCGREWLIDLENESHKLVCMS